MSDADLSSLYWLRSAVTAAAFLAFMGIVAWAWSRGARKGFDEAAQLPFSEDDVLPMHGGAGNNHQG